MDVSFSSPITTNVAPKVTPSILLCLLTTSERDVGGMEVDV